MQTKIIVYADDDEQYFSFITREAYDSLNEWMSYRSACGEKITGDSWLMRNLWDVTTPKGKGVVTIPKKLEDTGLKRLIERALWAQGVRTKLPKGKRRHEFQADHGFRKWFETRCISAGMISDNVKVLMNHSLGLSDSYYRPTEDAILNDYLKAVDLLTVNSDPVMMKRQVREVSENNQKNYLRMEEELKGVNNKVNRLVSLLLKQSIDGDPAFHKEEFERLVNGTDERMQFITTDCEYQDPIAFNIPSQDILIVRKEIEKRKRSSIGLK